VTLSLAYQGTADAVLRLDDASDTTWEPVTGATYSSGVATVATSSFSYYVAAQLQVATGAVVPLFPSAPAFNDYVKNDGTDPLRATGTACDPTYSGDPQTVYGDCIHSGEHRAVAVTGRSSCAGLGAVDALGAFDWTCEVLGGTATLVSTGFKQGAGLSTLIDFATAAWKANQVSVSDEANVILTTPSATWWSNPIVVDNDGMTSGAAGTIYLVTQDSGAFYQLTGDGSALVVQPGFELTGMHVATNSGRVELGGAFGLYFEGSITGTGTKGIHLSGSHHYLRNVRISGFDGALGPARRMRIEDAKLTCAVGGTGGFTLANGNLVRRVTVANCAAALHTPGQLNVVEDVFSSAGQVGIVGANQIVAGVTSHHSGEDGIELNGEGSLLMHATTAHNLSYGLNATSGTVPNRVIGLLSTENRIGGVYLDERVLLRNVGSFANTHYGFTFNIYGSGNAFEGAFTTGFNGAQPINYYTTDPAGCFNVGLPGPGDCYGSRADASAGSANGLFSLASGQCDYDTNSNVTSPFNPPLRGPGYPLPERAKSGDAVNPNDGPDGNAAFASVTNWVDFENLYRGWGAEGSATPSCESQGPCSATSTGPAGCQIFDYRLRHGADTFIARAPAYPDGNSTLTHVFSASSAYVLNQALCASLFEHSVYDATARTCTVTFLADAREILGDMRGNDNLLCESNEVCLFTQNLASYQGEGPLVTPAGYVFVNGTIQNVTLLAHETNGTSMPYSP
jgi:hypothetical protein